MRFIISLSIGLIAFDATKIRRIKQVLDHHIVPYFHHIVNFVRPMSIASKFSKIGWDTSG